MKAIVIYYSYSGNTKKVADILAEYLRQKYEVKISRLQAEDESRSFFQQAARAFWHKRARVSPVDLDLTGYDLICLGTPVWAFGPTPAMNAYLDKCAGVEGKVLALFTTYGSGAGVQKCFKYMEGILSKKGAKGFSKFSVQQFKVNNKEFINKIISENLQSWPDTRL